MDRVAGIELFVRVVETGSFSKAASELGITQPTATKHVAALEQRLGARLLNRNTRGVSATEIGALYYDKCKSIQRELAEADDLANLLQQKVGGTLRISTSVGFGRLLMVPLTLRFMQAHAELSVDLSFEDRYVNLVEQGIDLAVRMGRLADSSHGARYLGINPWVLVAAPEYLAANGTPTQPADLARHRCLIYSSVQGDDRWFFSAQDRLEQSVPVKGPLRSNNLSTLAAACRAGMGIAILPWYVAREPVQAGQIQPLLEAWSLPSQQIHAVFPSPKLVPSKVRAFIDFLQRELEGEWWMRPM